MNESRAALDDLTHRFFAAFTNRDGARPAVDDLYGLFLPQAVITKRSGDACEIHTLAQFIEPRRQLLTGGTLVDFHEEEVAAHTEVFAGIAQRWCTYRKAGVLNGRPFAGQGTKTIQFVQLDGAWRISALAWEDEPTAVLPPDPQSSVSS